MEEGIRVWRDGWPAFSSLSLLCNLDCVIYEHTWVGMTRENCFTNSFTTGLRTHPVSQRKAEKHLPTPLADEEMEVQRVRDISKVVK